MSNFIELIKLFKFYINTSNKKVKKKRLSVMEHVYHPHTGDTEVGDQDC